MAEARKLLTVLIVDDHPVFRRGLRGLLENADWVGHIVEAAGVEEAVRVATMERPDVIAMDLTLPDGSGIEATIRIRKARPQTAILALTMSNDASLVTQLLAAGARGYLLKETEPDTIIEALHAISRGAVVFGPNVEIGGMSPETSRHSRPTSPLDQLSSRERDVLTQLAAGQTNAQIGRSLALSEKTVRNYLSSVYNKLQVTDRTQAALLARDAERPGRP